MHNSGFSKKYTKFIILLAVAAISLYGLGRLYYRVTGGFMESNITYDLAYDPRWEITPPTSEEKESLDGILSQEFHYLGKGCQSYVFSSKDGQYVIKFFKFQRFRPQAWLDYFAFIPPVDKYRLRKINKKRRKLENVFTSWKIAYEELKPETGVVYVHLNKSSDLNKDLVIYDKLGMKHVLKLDNLEFMVQKKATMLCPTIDALMAHAKVQDAQNLLDNLLATIMSEYDRGMADNDHALMQNTGVYDGKPVHIDVGQFIKNPTVRDPKVYRQELYSKTYKFRLWMRKQYPELADYLESRLVSIIGDQFWTMKPELNKASMGRIPNVN